MNYRHVIAVTALAAGLSGCASMSSNYQSNVRYQDGSYYSPADSGYGDYYYAPEPRYDYYYDHSYFYGSPFYSFGSPCSYRYHFCSPFGYDPFFDSFYSFGWYGWYDPFWGPYRYYGHHRRHHHDDDDGDSVTSQPPSDEDDSDAIADDDSGMPSQRRWPGRVMAAPEDGGAPIRQRDASSLRFRPEPQRERVSSPEPQSRRSDSSSVSASRSSDSSSRSSRHRSERND